MIYSIKGKLLEKQKEAIIVEASGIAYEIIFLSSSYSKLPEINEEVHVYTHFIVREDAFLLFGFISREEKNFFNTLTSVPSVGPKTAYNIMNTVAIPRLIEAILREEEKCLTQVSGIGTKTAKRIILELKDKMSKLHSASKDAPYESLSAASSGAPSPFAEARLALGSLGFGYAEIDKMLDGILKGKDAGPITTEEILKQALKKR